MAIVAVAFVVLLLAGIPVAVGILIASAIGVVNVVGFDGVTIIQQMYFGLDSFTLLAIPFFIIAGGIASRGETAERLVNVFRVFLGRIPGSLGIATIFACAFFAAISGTTFATILAIGSIMYPYLIEAKYPKHLAVGMITAGGTLGILIPPSIPMVCLSVAMGSSVSKQFTAGFVPGILLALLWCGYVFFYAKKHDLRETKVYTRKEKLDTLKKGIPAILFPVIVLGGIYSGLATPTEAAVISIVYVLILEIFFFKSLSLKELLNICGESIVTSAGLCLLIAAAQALTWFITIQKLPQLIAHFIQTAIPNKVLFILVLNVFLALCGFFLDVTPLVLILGPILASTLVLYDIDFAQFGIICILNCELGHMTPPFGQCLFLSMSTFKQPMGVVGRGELPFIIILFIFILLVSFVPQISLGLPMLLGM